MRRFNFGIAIIVLLFALGGLDLFARDWQAQSPTQTSPPVVSVPGTVSQTTNPAVSSQPAVPVAQVQSPAAPSHFEDQALWALMISFVIQYLKKSKWFQWITPESSARLQTQFGFLAALCTAAGIHFAVTGSMLDGNGAAFTVTGLSVNAVKDIAWQWSAQQAWYRAIVKDTPALGAPATEQPKAA